MSSLFGGEYCGLVFQVNVISRKREDIAKKNRSIIDILNIILNINLEDEPMDIIITMNVTDTEDINTMGIICGMTGTENVNITVTGTEMEDITMMIMDI